MNKKSFQDIIIVGFAIFATIFGAGNLIFPTALGFNAGNTWNIAIIGFTISGIVLPLIAIIAVGNNNGSFENISDKVSKVFSKILLLSIMILILGLVGLPRIGAVTYELGINPLFPNVNRIVVSIVFYAITIYFAINPANVVDKIGKILTPVLIITLVIIIGKGIIAPISTPIFTGIEKPFTTGFFTGYEIGDAFGTVVIASLFTAAIFAKGYSDSNQLKKMTVLSTLVGGSLLFLVYGGLIYLGATGSSIFNADIERTSLLAGIVEKLLGKVGLTGISIAVVFACLTTSVGMTSAISNYITKITNKKLKYKIVVIVLNIVAGILSILGVEGIMTFAMPVLVTFYPALIILIIMGLFSKYIPGRGAYIGAAYSSLAVSILGTLNMYGMNIKLISYLPFADYGFSWILPSIVGLIIGFILDKNKIEKHV